MIEAESKTPEAIMAWLAGFLCQTCLGAGHRPGVPDFEGSREVSTQSGCDCHGTGRWLWRLLKGKPHAMRYEPQMGDRDAGYGCHYCDVPTPDVAVARRLDEQRCLKRPLGVRNPTLDILIDTGLDLGFATVFTPDEWDQHLPAAWITVRSGHKVDDLLHCLVALVERRQLHGLEVKNG